MIFGDGAAAMVVGPAADRHASAVPVQEEHI
jgi:hypothetical protein